MFIAYCVLAENFDVCSCSHTENQLIFSCLTQHSNESRGSTACSHVCYCYIKLFCTKNVPVTSHCNVHTHRTHISTRTYALSNKKCEQFVFTAIASISNNIRKVPVYRLCTMHIWHVSMCVYEISEILQSIFELITWSATQFAGKAPRVITVNIPCYFKAHKPTFNCIESSFVYKLVVSIKTATWV